MWKSEAGDATIATTLVVPPFCLLSDGRASKVIQEVVERLNIDQSEIEDIYPCTPFQEYLLTQTAASSTGGVVQCTYALPKNYAVGKFKGAWKEVFEANPILRTRIIQTDTGVFQAVLRGQPELLQGDDLKTYLHLDRAHDMHLDEPRLRIALITETGEEDSTSAIRYLVITIHHALHDEWSEALIIEQLEAAYGGASLQTRRFAPFVKYIQDTNSQAERFWKKELAQQSGSTAVFPPAHSPGYQLAAADSTSSCLLDLATEHKSSQFTLDTQLRLAWALVMHHFTPSEVVAFGAVVDGRIAMVPGIEATTGPTEAIIPCRVHFAPSMTIEESLYSIQNTSDWSRPFEQFGLQYMEKLSDSAPDHCKFQSLLVIRPRQAPSRSRLLRRNPKKSTTIALSCIYPLTLECNILDNSVELRATYDVEILSKAMMQHLLHHFKYIFAEISGDVTRNIAQIKSINSYDMAQLTEWHNELLGCQQQGQLMVHKLIEDQCHSQPSAIAVHAWDGDFSYHDVEILSSRLAAHLVGKRVHAESIVPVCFEKSKWLAVIMVGVVKAGAAFVLLDPSSQPLERMQLIVKQVKAQLIISSESFLSTAVQMPGTRSLLVANGAPCFDSHPMTPRYLPVITENTALYVIFTSGSTGTPKGVVIEHHGYSAGALSRCSVTGLNSSSRVLQFSSCSFDTFITDILDTLIVGACICIPSESARHSGLAQAARDMGVTYADLVPSVARLLNFEEIPTLKTLVLSGESVAKSDVADWAGKVRLCNLYGPAECSAVATGHAYSGPHSVPSNIGRVRGGVGWVVNPSEPNVLLPIGAVGELVVEGSIVGRGYLGSVNEQASSNFLNHLPDWRHEFPGINGDIRMYKTGDLVQYQEDGTLLFVGRKDDQVKLHGQRLELGDVEHHLRNAFPTSLDVVAAITSPPMERLVAFIVVGNAMWENSFKAPRLVEQALVDEGIRIASPPGFRYAISRSEKLLRERLPTYMVPTAYFPIQQLPRTSSGKVNRARLQQAARKLLLREGLANFTAARERCDASTKAEKVLQSIWAQVLGIKRSAISAEDGFLELGGDSIAAMRVATLAASKGLHISVPRLFQNESLRNLAAAINSNASAKRIMWEEETAFSPRILAHTTHRPQCHPLPRRGSPVEVLLTGATGRLGREILKQLIRCATVDVVHCVAVRRPKKLPSHDKVMVYQGDLSMPRLGMSEHEEAAVMKRCQAIIHCGAIVSFVQNYETMRSVNVESTKYLAALALESCMPFHYISTADVGESGEYAVIEEASVAWNEPPADGADGYTATKWVSEVFLERVNSYFGLGITIYRPSNIICDGDPEEDIVNNLLEYSRRMRIVPRLEGWEGQFDFIQGQVVAFNIVELLMAGINRMAQDGPQSRQGVQYIHESGETVIPISGLGAYLSKDDSAPLVATDMRQWTKKAIQEGMASIVGDFLCGIEETGERIVLSPIRTSRRPLTG